MERSGGYNSKLRLIDADDFHHAEFGSNQGHNKPAPFRHQMGGNTPLLDHLSPVRLHHGHPAKQQEEEATALDVDPSRDNIPERPSDQLRNTVTSVTATHQQPRAAIDQASIAQRLRDYTAPPPHDADDWLHLPEVPTALEIGSIVDGRAVTREITINPNRLDRPWGSLLEYLEAQYGLMREDAVANIREVVEDLRRDPNQLEAHTISNAQIYERVFISGITIANEGIAHRLEFSAGRAKRRIAWQSSKRLKPGTLVALTPANDNFHHKCLVAIVAARPLSQLEEDPPSIDVYFSDMETLEIDPQVEYLMVESSTGYYEACRHTLKALQHLARERFPMSEHLAFLQKEMSVPDSLSMQPIMDLNAAFQNRLGPGPIDILSDWPKARHVSGMQPRSQDQDDDLPATDLDESQFSALRRILTKRLAIVQGPPGTGKTHVSVIALRILVENKKPGTPPIIVTAQTNHALDQLLRHIQPFAPDFIRLGSQTQDYTVIEPRTLFNVKNEDSNRFKELRRYLGMARARNKGIIKEMKELLEPLMSSSAMSPDTFLRYGLITDDQYRSLTESADEWVGDTGIDSSDAILAWAKTTVQPFRRPPSRVQDPSQLEAEDDDFYAQKDAFLERGVLESDEKDLLLGPKFPVKSGFTAAAGVYDSSRYVQIALEKHPNLYDVPQRSRGLVYLWLQSQVKLKITDRFRDLAKILQAHTHEVKMMRNQVDANFLKEAPVIGMTTTGLSKYRAMLHSIQPQVVLIEEAAETQEAYVTAACFESLEQLILVGDHQQLQAQCQSKGMEDFNLHISLFERLVEHNQLDFQQLVQQRRMLPEMRHIINVIYPRLTDHSCVRGRQDIPGMGGQNTWFMTHFTEETMDDHFSWVNDEEAHLVAKFYEYLVINGTPADKITIITFYNGQKRKILSVLRRLDRFVTAGQLNVCTVDSYQGEENEVIILSLVRNNQKDKHIGFLSVNNRVCVAMSRARRGFYIFGNARQLHDANPTWAELIYRFTETGSEDHNLRLGKHLPLICANHGNKVEIRSSMDWGNTSGGCNLKCNEILACGHTCPLYCHPDSHDQLPCFEPCNAKLECGHSCSGLCNDSPCQCKTCEDRAKSYDRRRHERSRLQDESDPLSPRYARRAVRGADRSSKQNAALPATPAAIAGAHGEGYPSAVLSDDARESTRSAARRFKPEEMFEPPQRLSELSLADGQPAYTSTTRTGPAGLSTGAPVYEDDNHPQLSQPKASRIGLRMHSDAERVAAVQAYQEFAQGGARKADEALMRQINEKSNDSAFSSNHSSSMSSPAPRQPPFTVESTIVGRNGNRMKWTDRIVPYKPKLEEWESKSDAEAAEAAEKMRYGQMHGGAFDDEEHGYNVGDQVRGAQGMDGTADHYDRRSFSVASSDNLISLADES